MDDHREMGLLHPFDFAAEMWSHAPAMIAAQQVAVGEQIYVAGDELANIIAFLNNDEAQHTFGEDDLTDAARNMMDHEHGGTSAQATHSEEVGHAHGTQAQEDH